MKNVIGSILSAVLAAALAYFLKDPFIALIICIPVILMAQFLYRKANKKLR